MRSHVGRPRPFPPPRRPTSCSSRSVWPWTTGCILQSSVTRTKEIHTCRGAETGWHYLQPVVGTSCPCPTPVQAVLLQQLGAPPRTRSSRDVSLDTGDFYMGDSSFFRRPNSQYGYNVTMPESLFVQVNLDAVTRFSVPVSWIL